MTNTRSEYQLETEETQRVTIQETIAEMKRSLWTPDEITAVIASWPKDWRDLANYFETSVNAQL